MTGERESDVQVSDGQTVAVLGGGRMGEALLAGFLRSGLAPQQVTVSERDVARAEHLVATHGERIGSAREAVTGADVVLLAVKPADVPSALAEIAGAVAPPQLLVSVAAGVSLAALEAALPDGLAVVRCMPNTPALVGEAMSVLAGGSAATEADLDRAEALLGSVGAVLRLPEKQLDAVTALSGSGPAYVFLVVEALVDAGVLLGLPRPVATQLVTQTVLGAAVMLRDGEASATQLREAVTSPAGTTAAGLRALEVGGVRAAMLAAAEAAARRSAELGGVAESAT